LKEKLLEKISGVVSELCLESNYGIRKDVFEALQLAEKKEEELLREINQLKIGVQGLGGLTTCLGVNIEHFATHMAGLPVGVNISCYALREATRVLNV